MSDTLISQNSGAFLPAIKRLWRKHSDKLGYFPEGAFEDHARLEQILVAHSHKNELLGYLLFRSSRGDIVIVHLCVQPTVRAKGIAKSLVIRLKNISSDSRGISLKCRRDYKLEGFWSSLGFVAVNEVRGRGKDEIPLTVWWLDFGHPDLLASASRDRLAEKTCLVIDANVFYGLYSDDKEDDESKLLVADWLPSHMELCLTDEIYNEIDRRGSSEERKRNRQLAQSFEFIPVMSHRCEAIKSDLLNLLPSFKKTRSGRSDIRHLAKAIAGEALYFITRDQALLNHSDNIYERFQISVLRPCELILQLDSIERGYEYQPARLSGSQYQLRRIKSGELGVIVDNFLSRAKGERARDFQKMLASVLTNPRDSACYILEAPSGEQQALFVKEIVRAEIRVPLFRIARSSLSATIGRHLLRRFSLEAAREGQAFITITDGFVDERLSSLLANDGFILTAGHYTKVLLKGVIEASSINNRLDAIALQFNEKAGAIMAIRERIALALTSKKDADLMTLERMLWPVKLVGTNIPCFIVPIKPEWAKHLFDEHIASQDLFGTSDLIFNAELVFYRSKRPGGLTAPARIIWYVSHKKGYHGSGGIRAMSILEEVTTGKPKNIYAQYRRLGVYQWADLVRTVKNDLEKEIMALRFSSTHMVEKPLLWRPLREELENYGIRTTLQSPLKIHERVFSAIALKTLAVTKEDAK